MSKSWFSRLLLSYLPAFFIVTTMLFFLFFQVLNEQNRKEALKANDYLAQQVLQFTDNSLNSIEYRVVREVITNPDLKMFYEADREDVYENIQAVKAMDDLKVAFPLIDSVYLVRFHDNFVLGAGSSAISAFADAPFFQPFATFARSDIPAKWSGAREYKAFADSAAENVTTTVKAVPYFSEERKGMIVVNVSLSKLRAAVNRMYNPGVSFMKLIDSEGRNLLGGDKAGSRNNVVFSKYTSSYTGWKVESGFVNGGVINFTFNLYNVWIGFAIAVVLFGLFWVLYVTKRNYKPIREIVELIRTFSLQDQGEKKRQNEFGFIQNAIETLLDQTRVFKEQFKEKLIQQKRYRFQELLGGTRPVDEREWFAELEKYELHVRGKSALVVVTEIDGYEQFQSLYSSKDQSLLKFALFSAIEETVRNYGGTAWAEWLENRRLSCIIWFPEDGDPVELGFEITQSFCRWVEQNLSFTVTAGLGEPACALEDLRQSCEMAIHSLQYKAVLGGSRVIQPRPFPVSGAEPQEFFKTIHQLSQSLRLSEDDWKTHVHTLVRQMKAAQSPRKEIASLLQFLAQHTERECLELSREYREVWKTALAELNRLQDIWETADEIEAGCIRIFSVFAEQMRSLRETRGHRALVGDIRSYIEEHYDNANLSLDFLSGKFQVSPKYLSKIFKEEFGENFVDCLIGLRIEKAKEMMSETQKPIQVISQEVGYFNYNSFNRAFKNVVGLSPRDFRRQASGLD